MTNTTAERITLGAIALLFIASAAATINVCVSMTGGMPMPGGWTMSMMWMRMPGKSWLAAAAAFMGMWMVMMIAMMLPSLAVTLSACRRSFLMSAGYFFVWAVFGAAAYAVGLALAVMEMRWQLLARSVPMATGVVLLLSGCVQLSPWKLRYLERCRDVPSPDRSAWQNGLRLGVRCSLCCSGLMTALLVSGVMDLRVMAAVTAAITGERLAPKPERIARVAGTLVIAAGTLVIARSVVAA